jgi:hypothetical protein
MWFTNGVQYQLRQDLYDDLINHDKKDDSRNNREAD